MQIKKAILPPKRSTLETKLWKIVSKVVRLSHADSNGLVTCISCGKIIHWTESDAGHYITRRDKRFKYDMSNIFPQCKYCNRFLEGNKGLYRKHLVEKIGEQRVLMLESKMQTHKISNIELEILIKEYTEKLRGLNG